MFQDGGTSGLGALAYKDQVGIPDIVDLAVTTAKLSDSSVTNAKFANMSPYTVKARNTTTAGAPSDVGITELVSTAQFQATTATSVVDTEYVSIPVSESSLKKVTWANIKATLKTFFDTLYSAVNHTHNYLSTSGGTISGSLTVEGDIDCSGTVTGAVWNDYAEYREGVDQLNIEPGRVVLEVGDDTVTLCDRRLQAGCMVISDTFGFSIGETERANLPIAVAGRVLVYPDQDRETFEIGAAVCSGVNGTISMMTREEIIQYPERIIGTVSAIPNYSNWGAGNVKVNGRIWIKVR